MSKKKYYCKHDYDYDYDKCDKKNTFFGLGNCCCDFPTLIILILIILQFNRKHHWGGVAAVASASSDDCGTPAPIAPAFFGETKLIDNSILFIIALFFLSCCNPCKR